MELRKLKPDAVTTGLPTRWLRCPDTGSRTEVLKEQMRHRFSSGLSPAPY